MTANSAVPPPPTTQLDLAIGGMHCASCARRIERKVGKVSGVASVAVNLATEAATIQFDPAQTRTRQLKQAITDAGFTVLDGPTEMPLRQRRDTALHQQRRSLGLALGFWLPLFVLEMGGMAGLPLPALLSLDLYPAPIGLLHLALTLPVLFAARRVYGEGWRALAAGGPNMYSLILIGTGAAFAFSAWGLGTVLAGTSASFQTYFPAVSTILALMLLGKYLEERAKGRAGAAIEALLDLQPATALLVEDGGERSIPAAQIETGDLLRVRPGQRVPTDGALIEGRSDLDESLLTGESMPVAKAPGDSLVGGSLNGSGALLMRAERVGRDTVLGQIARLVQGAQQGKAPVARLADAVAAYFVPIVLGIAVVAAGGWLLAGAEVDFALKIFVAVLIIACPCSLGLATPTAIMVGTGVGARLGILVKSPEALEAVHRLDTIVLDKTGTVTEGTPKVTDILAFEGWNDAEVLRLAAAVEAHSEHPLAAAVRQRVAADGLQLAPSSDFEALPGRGARALVEGRQVTVGNAALMAGAIDEPLRQRGSELAAQGKTPVWVAVDGRAIGLLALADTPRPSSAAAIAAMRRDGLDVILLSGDHRATAEALAAEVGIDRVYAEVLPANKAAIVAQLQAEGRRVGMVGDGVNDAPALAQADVGIAISAGTHAAAEAADLVLMHDRLEDIPLAIRLSRATLRTIRQNLFWAFLYNSAGIPIAAGVLYLFGGPLLNPMLASLAMAFSSVSVVGNALRLRGFDAERKLTCRSRVA